MIECVHFTMKLYERNENKMLHVVRGRRQSVVMLLTGMLLLINGADVMASDVKPFNYNGDPYVSVSNPGNKWTREPFEGGADEKTNVGVSNADGDLIGNVDVPYYFVQGGENVDVEIGNKYEKQTENGDTITYNRFIVHGSDTIVTNSDDIVIDEDKSENPKKKFEKDTNYSPGHKERKYSLALSQALKDKINQASSANAYIGAVDSRLNRLGAQSAAMAALHTLQYDPKEPTTLMAGVGTYQGEKAFALGIAHYKNKSLLFHGGVSMGSHHDEIQANAGLSWKFGASQEVPGTQDSLMIEQLLTKNQEMEAKNQQLEARLEELEKRLALVERHL